MPNININIKRGYEAIVPVEKIWEKLEDNTIDKNFCIPLGETSKNGDKYINLKNALNILAVGSALSGMHVFRSVTLATLLKFNKPEDLKLVLIDPLKIYFFHFRNIDQYLLSPLITDNKKAIKALEWVDKEDDERFKIIIKNKVKNIEQYNKLNPDNKIPKIVIMITELGEIFDYNKNAEELIVKIIQMTKVTGIHFIMTTQRPSAKVITPFIKENISTKIAFKSGSKEASELILGKKGAEMLQGQGDMIVDDHKVSGRMQGYFISDENVEKLFT